MDNFFVFLFLICVVALPVAIVKPSLIFRSGKVGRKKAGAIFGGLTALFFILIGVTAPKPPVNVVSDSSAPTGSPSQSAASPSPSTIPTPAHNGVLVKVVNVVDGDTIKVETGETVRYIGIDTPETVHPDKPVMCYGGEASVKNTELVEGKIVEMEKDISEKDRYGRLLRYIWLGDALINELLVREGYAASSSFPPDIKYQDRFVEAQRLARQEQKGLWSSACATTATLTPTKKPVQSTPNSPAGASGGSYACNCSKTCAQMSSCAEAQYQLNTCGCSARDNDGDGIACDSDCQ